MFRNSPAIILSLDVSIKKAKEILKKIRGLKEEIAAVKISSLLCWEIGLKNVAEELREIGDFPLIFDAQKGGTDIPEIVRRQVELVAKCGIDAFISSPAGAGEAALIAFVDACSKYGIISIVVLEMTPPLWGAFLSEDAPMRILGKSLELGVTNFVAPANKPQRVKVYREIAQKKKREIKIFSPGIGDQGGEVKLAVKSGSDFIIIGRRIYQAEDPRQKTIQIYQQIKEALIPAGS